MDGPLAAYNSRFFKTDSGQHQIFVQEIDKKTNKFKLLFSGDLKTHSEGSNHLKGLLENKQVKQIGTLFSFETSVIDELFKFLYSAQETHLISDADSLQLQKFAQSSQLKLTQDSDVDEDMSYEVEALFNSKLCTLPSNSPFADTDLIVFHDSYSGMMPLNGIKEAEFKHICELYENICRNKTHLVVNQSSEAALFFEAIKILLTRDVGRRLIEKCTSNEKYGVRLAVGERSTFKSQAKTIELDVNDINLRIHASPDGFYRLDKQPTPLFITLAHEMIHHLHAADGSMPTNLSKQPTLEKEYDDLEEQATITGFYKEPVLADFISKDNLAKAHEHFDSAVSDKPALMQAEISENGQAIYDEFNERIFQAAYTDSKQILYPRFGHRGLPDRFKTDDAFKNLDLLAARILFLESEHLAIDLLDFLVTAAKKVNLTETKTWQLIKPCLTRLANAATDAKHPLYPQLQLPSSKDCLQALASLTTQRQAFLGVQENALESISRGDWMAEEAYAVWSDNADFMLQVNKKYLNALEYASPALLANAEFILAALQDNWRAIAHANPTMQDNLDIMLAAVNMNGQALEYGSPAVQANIEVVMAAVEMDGKMLKYASPKLQGNEKVVLAAVKSNPAALKFASQEMKNHQEIFLAALEGYHRALEWAGESIRKNAQMVMLAVRRSGTNLQFADKALQGNSEIALAAIQQDPAALCYASREIIKAQVHINGRLLKHAGPAMQKDREIVLAAILQDGEALKYAAPNLREDPELIRIAAEN